MGVGMGMGSAVCLLISIPHSFRACPLLFRAQCCIRDAEKAGKMLQCMVTKVQLERHVHAPSCELAPPCSHRMSVLVEHLHFNILHSSKDKPRRQAPALAIRALNHAVRHLW